ncbi:MAG: ABC transporter permease, partial [Rickettsiales bacterium]|nr:ABC transporter permease [Rickettsiales bacterium]
MAFEYFEFLVAWRYLKSKRKDGFISVITWLSLVGIMLGVATLVIVMSVMNGFREEMLAKILGMNGHVVIVPGYGRQTVDNYDSLIAGIASGPVADKFAIPPIPVVEGQVMAAGDNASQGALLKGLRARDMGNLEPLAGGILEKSLGEVPADSALVGYQLANRLGLSIGEEVTLTTARGNVTAFGTMPRISPYEIGATFKTGMSIYDSTYVFMALEDAQSFLNMEGEVSQIEIFLRDADDAREVAAEISKGALKGRAYAWQEQNSSFVSALMVERNVMFLILTLIILVASFNIISSLVMLTKDKSRDIAVFRTVGATSGSVMR